MPRFRKPEAAYVMLRRWTLDGIEEPERTKVIAVQDPNQTARLTDINCTGYDLAIVSVTRKCGKKRYQTRETRLQLNRAAPSTLIRVQVEGGRVSRITKIERKESANGNAASGS